MVAQYVHSGYSRKGTDYGSSVAMGGYHPCYRSNRLLEHEGVVCSSRAEAAEIARQWLFRQEFLRHTKKPRIPPTMSVGQAVKKWLCLKNGIV